MVIAIDVKYVTSKGASGLDRIHASDHKELWKELQRFIDKQIAKSDPIFIVNTYLL